MLGLIIVAPEKGRGLASHALMDELLGAPMLTRAIAGALPSSEPVTGVVVVSEGLVDSTKANVVDRFGLDEIDKVMGGAEDFCQGLRNALQELPDDIQKVVVQRGDHVLVPTGLVDKLVAASSEKAGAAPVVKLAQFLVSDVDGLLMQATDTEHLRELQFPVVLDVALLRQSMGLDEGKDTSDVAVSPVMWVAAAGGDIALCEGDNDNLQLKGAADVSRAVEVFARRAVDYPFVFPKDLLPNDPLAKALQQGDSVAAVDDQTEEAQAVSSED